MLIENQYLWFCMNGSLFHSLGPAKTEMLYLLYISQIQVPGESSTLLLFCCWTIQTSLLNSPRIFFSTKTQQKPCIFCFKLFHDRIQQTVQSRRWWKYEEREAIHLHLPPPPFSAVSRGGTLGFDWSLVSLYIFGILWYQG